MMKLFGLAISRIQFKIGQCEKIGKQTRLANRYFKANFFKTQRIEIRVSFSRWV